MSLLSLDILEGKTSKYETNHIHMIVDGDISFPVTNMNDKQYGTFFHEYIHYLQHFTTMFGVKICTMYNKMFILYVDYLKHNKTVKLPLELWKEDQGLMNFISFFNDIKGDRNCPHHIDEVEISPILTKLIPQKMVLALQYETQTQFAIYHTKLISSAWQLTDDATLPLSGLNLDTVWENIVTHIGQIEVEEGNTLAEQIASNDQRAKVLAQIATLERKMANEKQPRRKREYFEQIKKLKSQI